MDGMRKWHSVCVAWAVAVLVNVLCSCGIWTIVFVLSVVTP